MRPLHVVAASVLVALCSIGCSAAAGAEDDLVGANEDDVVDREGESLSGSLTVGATLTATDNVNLRSGAGTGFKVLKVIPAGSKVTVVSASANGSWYNVRYAGVSGWSHGGYLDRTAAPSTPPPSGGSGGCTETLTSLGLSWRDAAATKGIADPVTVASPIRGVTFRYVGASSSSPLLGNCALFIKLAAAADKMKAYGVSEFTHIGTYNYRTIAGSTKLSQHALGMAIDIAGFKTSGGVYYSLASNFTKNTSQPTCTQPRTTAGDKLLKGWACDVKAAGIFNIMLTPNYNDLHRDHFHVDLTSGSDMIRGPNAAAATGTPFDSEMVDPFSLEPLGDGVADEHDVVSSAALRRELDIQIASGATIANVP